MSILKFLTQDELDSLSDAPRNAFMELINFAQGSLDEQLSRYDPNDEYGREERDDLRYSFMNTVVAAAKNYGIEPFKSMEVPRYTDWRKQGDFFQFKSDLDHFITQLVLDNKYESRKDNVALSVATKEQIRLQIHALRASLEKADIEYSKREALLSRLDALEKELEKRRTSMLALAKVVFAIVAIPGTVWGTAEAGQKLITTLMTSVAEAEGHDDQHRLIAAPPSLRELSPPRTEKSAPSFGRSSGSSFGGRSPMDRGNLDDDIPF